MRILAIDMGKFNSVACDYVGETGAHEFETLATEPAALHDLIVKRAPDVVVIEISPLAGWVRDLCESMGTNLLVANTNDGPWRWATVKGKSDRKDALKAAKLQALGQLGAVHVPAQDVRQWRSLIHYRATLVEQVTSHRNRIRALVDQAAGKLPEGEKAFDKEAMAEWAGQHSKPLAQCGPEELYKGEIDLEVKQVKQLLKHIKVVEQKLQRIADADDRVKLLKTAPGVGQRTAEHFVAMMDNPNRFGRGKQVGCYVGLTPRKYQSGMMDRDGHISHGGDSLLMKYLTQAAWASIRSSQGMRALFERLTTGKKVHRKKAIVAVARHLAVRLWAMLRDNAAWREPEVAALAA